MASLQPVGFQPNNFPGQYPSLNTSSFNLQPYGGGSSQPSAVNINIMKPTVNESGIGGTNYSMPSAASLMSAPFMSAPAAAASSLSGGLANLASLPGGVAQAVAQLFDKANNSNAEANSAVSYANNKVTQANVATADYMNALRQAASTQFAPSAGPSFNPAGNFFPGAPAPQPAPINNFAQPAPMAFNAPPPPPGFGPPMGPPPGFGPQMGPAPMAFNAPPPPPGFGPPMGPPPINFMPPQPPVMGPPPPPGFGPPMGPPPGFGPGPGMMPPPPPGFGPPMGPPPPPYMMAPPGPPRNFNPGPTSPDPYVGPTNQGQQQPATSPLAAAPPASKSLNFQSMSVPDLNQVVASPPSIEAKLNAMEELSMRDDVNAQTLDLMRKSLASDPVGLSGPEKMQAIDTQRAAALSLALISGRLGANIPTEKLAGFKELKETFNKPSTDPQVKAAIVQGLRLLNRPNDKDIKSLLETAAKSSDINVSRLAKAGLDNKPALQPTMQAA